MSTAKKSRPRFRAGDWVTILFGTSRRLAKVLEDRGQIGVHRQQLYRIRFQDSDEDAAFEAREEDLEPAVLPDKAAVLRYLREGGLVAILSANLAGGRQEPRAWITFGPEGGVVHTFSPDRGLIGGETVPFYALHGNKVFTPKRAEVRTFLTTFGLTPEEAEGIVRAVGHGALMPV
jgi:hypothetical protein